MSGGENTPPNPNPGGNASQEPRNIAEQERTAADILGERGEKAIIAKNLSERDRENIVAEAIEMKEAKERANKGFFMRVVVNGTPIIGTLVRANAMRKFKKTIGSADNLTEGLKELGIDYKDLKTLNNTDVDSNERAYHIIENGIYNEEGTKAHSLLDENEVVELVGDKETQKKVKDAFYKYYEDFKKKKGDVTEEERKEYRDAFDETMKEALAGEKDSELLMKSMENRLSDLEILSKDKETTKKKVKDYVYKNGSLYRATTREGVYAKKEVDSLTNAVVAGSVFGVIVATFGTREARGAIRKINTFLGGTNIVGGALAGAVAGGIRGADKARVNLSDAEIKDATTFDAPKEEDTSSNKEGSAEITDRDEKKLAILERVKKYGVKGMVKGEDRLDELKANRNRINASDRISELNELVEKLNGNADEEAKNEAKKELEEKLFDAVARGRLSSKKQIDLIRYKDDEERNSLEKAITEAAKQFYNSDDLGPYLTNEAGIDEREQALNDKYEEAKKIEARYKARIIAVNVIMGAAFGGSAAAVFDFAAPYIKATFEDAKEGIGALLGLHTGDVNDIDGTDPEIAENLKEFRGKPILIEDDPDGGIAIGIDKDNDGIIDAGEFIRGEGDAAGIDLTNDQQFEELNTELGKYNIELQREAIDTSRYGETSIEKYLSNAENSVDNSGGVDWSRSATKVAFGTPTAAVGDGMDTYEVPVWGVNGESIPDGAKFYVDLDGDGPGEALEYTIENGKAIVPADVLDTSRVGNGGAASFIGTARVGEMDGNTMISYATAFGKDADLSTTISATEDGTGFAFTALDTETHESIGQFAVNGNNEKISNLSEIFNGVKVGDSDRLPSTFVINDVDKDESIIALASGGKVSDLDYRGGYHAEFDSYENTPFMESKSFLGTPIHWDLDGDGQMNATEEATYFQQLLVRTGTNPFMLGQNASNYGILEPSRLESIIPATKLTEWGITDGVVDSETELNVLIEHLKMPENAEYYDGLVNATINEMEKQLQGGGFTVETITDRVSTYANSGQQFDTWRGDIERTIIYPHDAEGNAVGNTGWWCRKYGLEGQRVGDMPLCEQKGGEVGEPSTGTEPTGTEPTGTEPTGDEPTGTEPTGTEPTGDEPTGDEPTGTEPTGTEPTGTEPTGDEPTGDEPTGDEPTGDEITPKTDNPRTGDETDLPVAPSQEDDYVQPTTDNHEDPGTQPGSQVNDAPTDNSAYNPVDHDTSSGNDTRSSYSNDTSKWQGDKSSGSSGGNSGGGGGGGSSAPAPAPSNADPGSASDNVNHSDEELANILNDGQ